MTHDLRLALLRRVCGWLGHGSPSWVAALARGITDRPVCADCGAKLAPDADRTVSR
jgi:hypothetical protein